MSENEQQSAIGDKHDDGKKSWFARNRSGLGMHPRVWQGWLILLAPILAIAVLVVLLKTGLL